MDKKKIYLDTLGCKVNQYETACVLDEFLCHGYEETQVMDMADVVIINTCTVTNRTDYKSRNLIAKAVKIKHGRPGVKIVVTGCYGQNHRDEIMASGLVDFVVDNNDKNRIFEYIKDSQKIGFTDADEFMEFTEMSMNSMNERSRAFLKIQDGCDFNCSYCIVPSVRGKPRCRSFESIIKQVEKLLAGSRELRSGDFQSPSSMLQAPTQRVVGYEEIVLGGINLGLYADLDKLLYTLAKYDKLKRIRLSSIEPQLFSDSLLTAIGDINKVCPHFHIPLQTGSDYLLKLHGRKYTTKQFKELISKLQAIKPHCAFGFDVIVGLPSETDELFNETYELLKCIDLAYLHVFIYSKRKGTEAAKMKAQVHGSVAKERSNKLLELEVIKREKYINKLIEEKVILYAVAESYDVANGMFSGTTDRYVKARYEVQGLRQSEIDTTTTPRRKRHPSDRGELSEIDTTKEGMRYEVGSMFKLIPIKNINNEVYCEVIK